MKPGTVSEYGDEGSEFLKKYAKKNKDQFQFFKPPQDGSIDVVFLKSEPVQNYFNDEEDIIPRYHLLVNGKPQFWDRPSKSLAIQMSELKMGDKISIRMIPGKHKNQTKYEIKKVA